MIRSYKYRIYPTTRQQETLNNQLALCCELYNAAIQERRDAWKTKRTRISFIDQVKQLTELKSIRTDLEDVHCKSLETALKRVDAAFNGFYYRVKKKQNPGYPRFRSVARYDSLTLRKVGHVIQGNKLRVSKVGQVRIKLHRPFQGLIKALTIKRESGRWFAIFQVDQSPEPLSLNVNMVGIDVGLDRLATLSDGTAIENPRWFRKAQSKLRRLQRRAARRKKGSNRRRKTVLLLSRFYNHVRDQRKDFHHKESRKIVNNNGFIAVEDLNVKGLAGGMLAKSVHDAGWSSFINMLVYKAEDAGRLLVKVDPRGTSQTCLCGASVPKALSQREHVCIECGLVADRDHVSAQIILARSLPSSVNVGEVMPCVA